MLLRFFLPGVYRLVLGYTTCAAVCIGFASYTGDTEFILGILSSCYSQESTNLYMHESRHFTS